MTQDALRQYKDQKIMLSSPVKQVSMLYNEAIRQLNIVIQSIEANEIEARWRANTRCTDIIYHMLITLDQERGGEIAGQLEKLFTYILKRLPEVDLKNNAKAAQDVINLLTPLAESWQILAERDAADLDQAVSQALESQPAQSRSEDSQAAQSEDSADTQPSQPSQSVAGQYSSTPLAPPVEETGDEDPKPSRRVALSA